MALDVVERFLRLACAWPAGRGRAGYVVGVYVLPYSFAFTSVLPAACLVAGMHASAMDRVDLLTDVVATSLCFVKLRCMQRHVGTLLEIRRLLRDDFGPLEVSLAREAAVANARCERRAGRLTYGYVALYSSMSLTAVAIMALSLVSGDPRDRKLTTTAPEAVLLSDALFYPVLCGIGIEVYIFPIAAGVFDALFLTLCLHLACKCDILRLLLGCISRDSELLSTNDNTKWVKDAHISIKVGVHALTSPAKSSKDPEEIKRTDAVSEGSVDNHIRDCVIYHQLIIQLHKLTEGIFSTVTLCQMIYFLFGVGTPGIRILNGSLNGEPYKILFAMTYVFWNVCQLFTFCWFGDKVARMIMRRSYSLYSAIFRIK